MNAVLESSDGMPASMTTWLSAKEYWEQAYPSVADPGDDPEGVFREMTEQATTIAAMFGVKPRKGTLPLAAWDVLDAFETGWRPYKGLKT